MNPTMNTITITSEQPKELTDDIYKVLRGEAAFAPPNWKDLVLQKCLWCTRGTPSEDELSKLSEGEQIAFPAAFCEDNLVGCPLIQLRREILSDAEWQARMQNERQKANKT